MINSRKLKERLNEAKTDIDKNIGNMRVVAKDAERVSNIAKDVHIIITDIDKQFAEKTKLSNIDMAFMFLATGLQVGRQYLLPNNAFKDVKRITPTAGDKLVKEKLNAFFDTKKVK
jgi:hypothetical protein